MINGDSRGFRRLFPQKQIPIILSAILREGESIRKKTEKDREDWLSRRLCSRLIKIPIFRDGPLGIHPKQEILSSDPESDGAAGEIDILVSCGRGSEVYFAIEAKRLRFTSSGGIFKTGSDEYVKNGMMRFVEGKYAPFMERGAMLGYVFDGDTETARFDIDRYISKKAKMLMLMTSKQFEKSGILPREPVYETHHDLNRRVFIIYHMFLEV